MAITRWYHFDTIVTVLHETNGIGSAISGCSAWGPKGRPVLGAVLGFFLNVLGWIIIAMVPRRSG